LPEFAIFSSMLQHVGLPIPKPLLGPCEAFWGLLGFTAIETPPGIAGRAAWLECAGTHIHLQFVAEAADARPGEGHVAVVA
jgi:hypothetical protein